MPFFGSKNLEHGPKDRELNWAVNLSQSSQSVQRKNSVIFAGSVRGKRNGNKDKRP